MLVEIIHAEPLVGHAVLLRFDDGAEGVADVATLVDWTGVFSPLRDESYFRQLRLDRELGTIVWPNGADIDPLVLWSAVTGRALTYDEAPV
jgi:hypothetical protein